MRACEKILSALRKGDGIGEPGAMDTSTISIKDLHAALELAKNFHMLQIIRCI